MDNNGFNENVNSEAIMNTDSLSDDNLNAGSDKEIIMNTQNEISTDNMTDHSMKADTDPETFSAEDLKAKIKKEKKKYFASFLWKITLCIGVILIAQTVLMLPFSAVFGFMDVYAKQSNGTFASFYNEINSNGSVDSIKATFNLLLLTVTDTIGALVLMLITQKSKVVPEQKKLKFGWGIVLFLCCFGIGGVGSLVGAVVNSVVLLPGTAFQMIMNNILTGSDFNINQSILYGNDSWVYLITTIFVVGIFVPILEELIFRKLVVDNTSKYGYGAAIMISAFTFAVFHGNFTQFFYAFGLGLLFAYVYANTGKIRYTIFFHMGYNLYASAIMPLARKLIPTGVLNSIQSSLTQMTESIQSNPEGFMDAYNRYTFEISNYIQDPRVVLGILVTASANIFYFILIIVGFILMLVFLKKALGIRKNMMLGEKGTKRCAAFNWGAILFYVLGAGVFLFYYGVVYFGMIVQSFR